MVFAVSFVVFAFKEMTRIARNTTNRIFSACSINLLSFFVLFRKHVDKKTSLFKWRVDRVKSDAARLIDQL